MERRQIVVVGAGPVGLTTALGLAQAGAEVLVVERSTSVRTTPRAIAYMYPVLEGLEELGLREDLEARGGRGLDLSWFEWRTGEMVRLLPHYRGLPVRYPYILNLGQDEVTQVLRERIAGNGAVELRDGHEAIGLEQADDGVRLTVRGPEGEEVVHADWVVGTDGARSTVRRLAGAPFEGMTWEDRFVATDIRADFSILGIDGPTLCLDDVVGGVIAPIGVTGKWRYTYRESAELDPDGYVERIRGVIGTLLHGDDGFEVVQHALYHMHQRCAPALRVGRVLLAGDAAHATNPTGGFGLNSGFMDAFMLAEALGAVVSRRAGDGVLDQYARARRDAFLNGVSPAATQAKQAVYSLDPTVRGHLMAHARDLAASPEKQHAELLGVRDILKPTPVDLG